MFVVWGFTSDSPVKERPLAVKRRATDAVRWAEKCGIATVVQNDQTDEIVWDALEDAA
jgi:hypothetical protein